MDDDVAFRLYLLTVKKHTNRKANLHNAPYNKLIIKFPQISGKYVDPGQSVVVSLYQ